MDINQTIRQLSKEFNMEKVQNHIVWRKTNNSMQPINSNKLALTPL
jgi:hypothetical protein